MQVGLSVKRKCYLIQRLRKSNWFLEITNMSEADRRESN